MQRIGSSWLLVFSMIVGSAGCADDWEADAIADSDRAEQALGGRSGQHGRYATRWVENSFQTVRDQNVFAVIATRLYAMVTVAIYDAVNGIDRARGHGRDHALVPPDGAPTDGMRAAAAAAAAHRVLVAIVPPQAPVLDEALAADLEELACDAGHADVEAGRAWGAHVGDQVVALRAMDGTQDPPIIVPGGTGPGEHRTDVDIRFANMTPFGIASKDDHQAPPPPALTSAEYTASFLESLVVGTADGDPARDEVASFWRGGSGTATESAIWLQAGIAIADDYRVERSLSDTSRLYALLGMVDADATLVSVDAKVDYFTWRVVPAIHEADTDGNPDTTADPAWAPRTGTGNLETPEYNSAAAAIAGSSAAVIDRFFCGHDVGFCFQTDGGGEASRCFATPFEAADEAGEARVLQGVHFRFSIESGLDQGLAVGEEVATTRLQRRNGAGKPLPACSR
jgi:hypothetical protein